MLYLLNKSSDLIYIALWNNKACVIVNSFRASASIISNDGGAACYGFEIGGWVIVFSCRVNIDQRGRVERHQFGHVLCARYAYYALG